MILTLGWVVLLVGVTGGVVYLTLADWRDRRRLEDETRQTRRSTSKRK
jgi:CHASE3 domain sensor protein